MAKPQKNAPAETSAPAVDARASIHALIDGATTNEAAAFRVMQAKHADDVIIDALSTLPNAKRARKLADLLRVKLPEVAGKPGRPSLTFTAGAVTTHALTAEGAKKNKPAARFRVPETALGKSIEITWSADGGSFRYV